MSTNGKFGKHGGKFVPETLISCLSQLEAEFNSIVGDPEFQAESVMLLRDYVGRETPLYFPRRLTEYHMNSNGNGPLIYLKREDLNHSGAHKINNAIGQAMLAKRMGQNCVVAATGAGPQGLAVASACARLSLQCTIYMGALDMEKHSSNGLLMKLLGAQVKGVEGSFKDAMSQAIRDWVENLATTFYLLGTIVRPHPCPTMVREFQAVTGKETRRQAMEKWGGKPDVLVACVGSGSNAIGLSHSIGVGLEYPGVGPELSFLKDTGRAEFCSVTDQQAVDAYKRLCRLEGMVPALEASHALAFLERLCPTLANGTRVVVTCSGRGDKDVPTAFKLNHTPKEGTDI